MAALLQITTVSYYRLWQLYCKLRQNVITNYGSFIKLLQITATFVVIKNYDNTLLQIMASITNCDVITNYVITAGVDLKCLTIFYKLFKEIYWFCKRIALPAENKLLSF